MTRRHEDEDQKPRFQLKRGKKEARPDAIKLKLGKYLRKSHLPQLPAQFGHVRRDLSGGWGMLGNDKAGDCVMAGAAHESIVWSIATSRVYPRFTDQTVLDDYSECLEATGQSAFDPEDESTDTGLDMQMAAKWRQEVGVADDNGRRHLISAYAALDNYDQLCLATYLFGVCGLGLQLPDSAEEQFTSQQPWSDTSGNPTGGHYVPVVGKNSAGNLIVITWGQLQAVTPQFVDKYMDEAVAYISTEYLETSGSSPEALNLDQLQSDMKELVGEDHEALRDFGKHRHKLDPEEDEEEHHEGEEGKPRRRRRRKLRRKE